MQILKLGGRFVILWSANVFRCVLASLYEVVSVGPSVRRSVRPCVTCFIYMPKMKDFLHQITNDDSILGLLGLVSDEFKTATGRKVDLGLPISASMFLDASSHLYKRVCLTVHQSVRPSIRP